MTNFFLTLVSNAAPLKASTLNIVGDFKNVTWLAPEKAADIHLLSPLGDAALTYIRTQLAPQQIDVFYTPAHNRKKRLLLADMDSTIVTEETLDELAAHAGLKDEIAAITARAMNAELDFHDALHARVSKLKNLPINTLDETLARTPLTPGARTFVHTMRSHGATCVLVSGGFTHFTKAIAQQVGFHHNHGNTLDTANGKLTGTVSPPILDKNAKLAFLKDYCAHLNLSPQDALTIGDGANDLPMLEAAGLGLGFHAKPAVTQHITNTIRFGDLTAALFAQGYSIDEFVPHD